MNSDQRAHLKTACRINGKDGSLQASVEFLIQQANLHPAKSEERGKFRQAYEELLWWATETEAMKKKKP
jgi:hypothetical protein